MFNRIRSWYRTLFPITPAKARKLWSKALRSGNYKQTKGKLHDEIGYCCLGVGCAVYQQYVGDLAVVVSPHDSRQFLRYDDEATILPQKVQKWLGISSHGHLIQDEIIDGRSHHALTTLNDDAGFTFTQVADFIDAGKVKTSA